MPPVDSCTGTVTEVRPETPFTPLSPRIERFAAASRARGEGWTSSPRLRNLEHAFSTLYRDCPYWERYALSMAYALAHEPVHLLPDERLVGMLYQNPHDHGLTEDTPNEFREAVRDLGNVEPDGGDVDPFVGRGGSQGHIGWRWDRVLALGVDGLMARIRELLADAADDRARELYRGALILWQAVLEWNDRHVQALCDRLDEASGDEKLRLQRLVEVCSRVPRLPARSFHEAAQAFHFQHQSVMFESPYGGNGPGRVDAYLWPYLERDLADGVISHADAKELVDELLIRFHERLAHGDGWVEAIAPGGVLPDGRCAVNPLSSMIIESIAELDQTHPTVYPRVSAESPEPYVDLCVNYLLHGRNRAQIYNDEACIEAIVAGGTPVGDARSYMAGGCMEISVQGAASDLNFARTHNVAKILELVLNGGVDLRTGERRIPHERTLADYGSFEELYSALEQELAREYREMVRALDAASADFARRRPCYLLSSLVDDCLERGREQQDGGARYHDYGFAPLGITAAADSLTGVKLAVFDRRTVSAELLLTALRTDFAEAEPLRLELRALPKYGTEEAVADAMVQRVLDTACRCATTPVNRFGGRLKPMVFNFVWTPGESAVLGARADGSKAGARIGHGITPVGASMTKGITAAMNSVAAVDASCVWGGATTMWDMDHSWITFDTMKSLLLRFFDGGGMIFQGNTTSVAELEEAMACPERHPNLIVRVGGFSARFVGLAADLQQEIVSRYRHAG